MPSGLAVLVLVLLFGALSPPAAAQSFNCRAASTADEIAICENDGLSALDLRLARLYARLRDRLSRFDALELEAQQRAWLASRRRCGDEERCIERHYRARIRELAAY